METMLSFEEFGVWWNDKNIELVKLTDGYTYALNDWNGESFTNCWRVVNTYDVSNETFDLVPVEAPTGEESDYTTIGYIVRD